MKKLMMLSILLIMASMVYAREYCCVGPYYCEGFDDYDEARASCMLQDSELASSYGCSHKHNHYFCQSCCIVKNVSYVVFDKNDCQDGVFMFQSRCENLSVNVFGTVKDKKGNELSDIEVTIGKNRLLTKADGRFNATMDRGTYNIIFRDINGKYKGSSISKSLSSAEVNVGMISLAAAQYSTIHGEENNMAIANGYIRSNDHPYSLYLVGADGMWMLTRPTGYFEFSFPSGHMISSVVVKDLATGNEIIVPYTMKIGKSFFFYKII